MSAGTFRFGLSAVQVRSRGELRALAQRLEAGGWSTLLVPDHLGMLSSFAPLVTAAEATTSLRVGTLVINSDFFHPLRLAQEGATVDLLTEGRLELGLGAGWARDEYDLLGVAYDRPPVRAARLGEAVRAMKAAWSGSPAMPGVSEIAAAVPAPHQRPHPPLLIGGHGDATMSLAADEADIIGLTGLTWTGSSLAPTGGSLDALAERSAFVRQRAGERAESLEFNLLVQAVSIGDPLDTQVDRLAAAWGVPADAVRTSPLALVGSREEVIERLVAARERVGISYIVVFDATLDAMEPIVEELSGK